MTDQIPTTIEFYDITPRIRRLFAEVWSTLPADERAIIAARLLLVEAARKYDENFNDIFGRAGGGGIELAQWTLKDNELAKIAISHELAHILLHDEDPRDYSVYHDQIELEANLKAKEWGYEDYSFFAKSAIHIVNPIEDSPAVDRPWEIMPKRRKYKRESGDK